MELGDGGLDEQQQWPDDSRVGGQGLFGLNGIEASSDSALAPYVVSSEEGDERILTSESGCGESRPALEKCGKDGCVFVAEPAEDLREVPFQRASEPVRDGDAVIHERSSKLHHSSEAAHVCALGLQAGQPLGIPKQQLQGEFGVGWVVLCTTGDEGLPILGE